MWSYAARFILLARTAAAAFGVAIVLVSIGASRANAQAIERHVPEMSGKGEGLGVQQEPLAAPADDRPVGITLKRIVLIEGDGPSPTGSDQPIQLPLMAGIREKMLTKELSGFLGQQLSRRRISEIVSRVVSHLRKSGYPVAAVTVPEQDISEGLLALRLFSFTMGKVTINGISEAEALRLRRTLRQKTGEPISMPHLAEDVASLNSYPFRSVSGSFAKGEAIGTSDLVLDVAVRRPLLAALGMVDVGSHDGRGDRYYASLRTGSSIARDLVLGYQLTGSRDFWIDDNQPFANAHPEYLSHSAAVHFSLVPRHQVEATVSRMTSQRLSDPFLVRSGTTEVTLGYRGALSDYLPLRGDVRLGIEARRQERRVLFDGVSVVHAQADIVQVYVGWDGEFRDGGGLTQFDLALHVSPGGLGSKNSAQALGDVGNGDPISARYAYAILSVGRTQQLGAWGEIRSRLYGQLTDAKLPITEQASLGGPSGIRAYGQDTGAFDQALVWTNRLYASSLRSNANKHFSGEIEPYLSADLGWARTNVQHGAEWASSLGAGASIRVGPLAFDLNFSCTLIGAGTYMPGECRTGLRGGISI